LIFPAHSVFVFAMESGKPRGSLFRCKDRTGRSCTHRGFGLFMNLVAPADHCQWHVVSLAQLGISDAPHRAARQPTRGTSSRACFARCHGHQVAGLLDRNRRRRSFATVQSVLRRAPKSARPGLAARLPGRLRQCRSGALSLRGTHGPGDTGGLFLELERPPSGMAELAGSGQSRFPGQILGVIQQSLLHRASALSLRLRLPACA
jgi:hypothetical protein